jgi:hypothetical protein
MKLPPIKFPTAPASCRTCAHSHDTGLKRGELQCRRYPPTAVVIGSDVRAEWPVTDPKDRCGEYTWSVA